MAKPGMRTALVCALPLFAALLACGEGGNNANQRKVGDSPGGVTVGLGDIAVAPVGNYVVFRKNDALAMGSVETGAVRSLPVRWPSKLAFSKQRPVVYVGRDDVDELVAVDVTAQAVLWHQGISDSSSAALRLESSPDDRFVVAGDRHSVTVIDAASGRPLATHSFAQPLVDLEILPDSKRALIVEQHVWSGADPETHVTLIDLETSAKVTLTIPNCADDIVVSADGSRAFLAPTTCQKDPVSVLDLRPGYERFERNLPGFGPVARAPNGSTVVAFYDRQKADAALFDDSSLMPGPGSARYHLMLIDSRTLGYEFAEVGESLPRYAVTPDGNVLLLDSDALLTQQTARLFDVPTRSFRSLSGPPLALDNFTLSSDSRHAYVLYETGLFDVNIPNANTSRLGLDFVATNLNISADDRYLFLRRSSSEVCIYDIAARACRERFLTVNP